MPWMDGFDDFSRGQRVHQNCILHLWNLRVPLGHPTIKSSDSRGASKTCCAYRVVSMTANLVSASDWATASEGGSPGEPSASEAMNPPSDAVIDNSSSLFALNEKLSSNLCEPPSSSVNSTKCHKHAEEWEAHGDSPGRCFSIVTRLPSVLAAIALYPEVEGRIRT